MELAPGLHRWTTPHPRWRPGMDGPGGWEADVASVAFETDGRVVLIDPLVEDWTALDALVAERAVTVLLAARWHRRSSDEMTARYGAGVTNPAPGEVLPGVVALALGGLDEGEVLLWLPRPRALVSAEALTGSAGGLRVAESPALRDRGKLDASLQAAAARGVEMVLPSHGPPVLTGGSAEIEAALRRPPW